MGEFDAIPDETTIPNFRRLLETHDLARQIFERVDGTWHARARAFVRERSWTPRIIAAPSSTQNKDGQRDPEMHQTKKGNQWHFGMKAHIGVDDESGLVHHVECTAANVADVTQMHKLLHGQEDTISGDSGYTGAENREELKDVDTVFLKSHRQCAR